MLSFFHQGIFNINYILHVLLFKINYFIVVIITICFISCHSHKLKNREEILDYVRNPKNELVRKKSLNGLDIKAYYWPYQLVDFNNHQEYEENIYIMFSFSFDGKDALSAFSNQEIYPNIIKQMIFNMENNVECISSEKDTLLIIDSHTSRLYGHSKTNNVLIVFNNTISSKSSFIEVSLKDLGLHIGEQKFQFNIKDIDNINKKINNQ